MIKTTVPRSPIFLFGMQTLCKSSQFPLLTVYKVGSDIQYTAITSVKQQHHTKVVIHYWCDEDCSGRKYLMLVSK